MRVVVTSTGSCTEHVQPRFPTRLPPPRLHTDAAIEAYNGWAKRNGKPNLSEDLRKSYESYIGPVGRLVILELL